MEKVFATWIETKIPVVKRKNATEASKEVPVNGGDMEKPIGRSGEGGGGGGNRLERKRTPDFAKL